MGWTEFRDYPELSRAEIIRRELSQAPTAENPRAWGFEYITERGSTVYAIGWHDAPDQPRRYFGLVCLTSRHRSPHFGRAFSYKDMTEDMGPYKYEAPKKMLDLLDQLAPNPTGYAKGWREACREHLARKKTKKHQAGDKVKLWGHVYTLQAPAGPRRGWHVRQDETGQAYRMNAHQLSKAQHVENQEPPPVFSKEVTPEQFMRDHFQIIHVTG